MLNNRKWLVCLMALLCITVCSLGFEAAQGELEFRVMGNTAFPNFYVNEEINFDAQMEGVRLFRFVVETDEAEPETVASWEGIPRANGYCRINKEISLAGDYKAYVCAYSWEGAATPTDLGEGTRSEKPSIHPELPLTFPTKRVSN